VDTASEISELRQKLILKTLELDEANKLLAELTTMLAGSDSELKLSENALAVSDAELMAKSDDLNIVQDALRASDLKLTDMTRQLAEAVREMAIANRNLTLQEKMQKAFINIAAHELKTPIQPIIGILELLESSLDKGEYHLTADNFEIIKRSVKRLDRLAQDILDVAKIEGDTFKMDKEPLDLGELVATAIKDYMVLAKKSNTRLNYLDGKKIIVSANRNRILQVISNLIDNALKFSSNGTVTISSTQAV
jgi:signal transduction histidine kinase